MNTAPAKTKYYSNGIIYRQLWYDESRRKQLNSECYYFHRIDGPAMIGYYMNGSVHYKDWWVNGKRHRLAGPAVIAYDHEGNITYGSSWWVNGNYVRYMCSWLDENNITAPYSPEDQMAIMLKWG